MILVQTLFISGVKIINANEKEYIADILVEDGKIKKIGSSLRLKADKEIDGSGKILFPGYIDMHIHGSAGKDTMDATTESLHIIARSLVKEGTTSFLATTMTQEQQAIKTALKNIAHFESAENEAEVIGIHVEGPYISKKCAGAQPVEHIIPPSIDQFTQWQRLSGYKIKEITVAPEVNGGFEFVEALAKESVVISIGHSDATIEEVEKAISLGVKQVTHLYNKMRPFHHRELGVVGGVLLSENVKVELIVDFIHVHPRAVDFTYRVKGANNIILITDAMRAKGEPNGHYDLGGQLVHLTPKGAYLPNGSLAGSVLTMDLAVRNMRKATNCTLQELVAMSSTNACKQMGITSKGHIAEGLDADFVLLDQKLYVQKTIRQGKIVFDNSL